MDATIDKLDGYLNYLTAEVSDQLVNFEPEPGTKEAHCSMCLVESFLEKNTTGISSELYAIAKVNPKMALGYIANFCEQVTSCYLIGKFLMKTMTELFEKEELFNKS